MGHIRLDSLSDFARHGYNAKVICEGCGQTSTWDASELRMQLHARRKSQRIEDAERAMRCQNCGEKVLAPLAFADEHGLAIETGGDLDIALGVVGGAGERHALGLETAIVEGVDDLALEAVFGSYEHLA